MNHNIESDNKRNDLVTVKWSREADYFTMNILTRAGAYAGYIKVAPYSLTARPVPVTPDFSLVAHFSQFLGYGTSPPLLSFPSFHSCHSPYPVARRSGEHCKLHGGSRPGGTRRPQNDFWYTYISNLYILCITI